MSPPGTAREALLAEVLGDLGRLLDRLEAIAPRIDAAGRTLGQAADRLDRQAAELDQQLAGFTDKVKVQAVRHIAGRTDELARQSLAQQTKAMQAAALAVFVREAQAAHRRAALDASDHCRLLRRLAESRSLVALLSALLASAATWLAAKWCLPMS